MNDNQRSSQLDRAGAFLSSDSRGMIAVPIRTLADEYHDEPAEPQDSERVPMPAPVGHLHRLLSWLRRKNLKS